MGGGETAFRCSATFRRGWAPGAFRLFCSHGIIQMTAVQQYALQVSARQRSSQLGRRVLPAYTLRMRCVLAGPYVCRVVYRIRGTCGCAQWLSAAGRSYVLPWTRNAATTTTTDTSTILLSYLDPPGVVRPPVTPAKTFIRFSGDLIPQTGN
jgi:hypothetical protein